MKYFLQMQFSMGMIALSLLTFSSASAQNRPDTPAGVGAGGGGARIEGAFRLRAIELANKVSESPQANELCSGELLLETLHHTRVRAVNRLVDPMTHQALGNRALDAWTTPASIQLLARPWQNYLDSDAVSHGRSIDVLILHEMYRATMGRCDDDNYQISERVPGMFLPSPRISQIYRLTRLYRDSILGEPINFTQLCDTNVDISNPEREGTCLSFSASTRGMYLNVGHYETLPGEATARYRGSRLLARAENMDQRKWIGMLNMWEFLSEQRPMYVVLDLTTGSLAYGLDLSHLVQVNE